MSLGTMLPLSRYLLICILQLLGSSVIGNVGSLTKGALSNKQVPLSCLWFTFTFSPYYLCCASIFAN